MTHEPVGRDYNDRHAYERDKNLSFDTDTHIYTYLEENKPLASVTSFISKFFEEYDPFFWLKKDASLSPEEMKQRMYEQEQKGFVARNLGTFMHTQIENFFLGEMMEYILNLDMEDGTEKSYSIEKELCYFEDFVREYRPVPYRTEWMIYDEDLELAGTLDLLVQEDDGSFTIYDWKRSRRMGREFGAAFYPNNRNFHQSGFGVLSHLADTPFIHASLQQNLYRQILMNKYGIEVKKMYLVVLSPTFSRFHMIPVPNLENEVQMMLM